jgi:hypothetical protein
MMDRDETTKTYQGWPTYETWLVYSMLTNEENLYYALREIAGQKDKLLIERADNLKDFVEELCGFPQEGFAAALIQSALVEVNWRHIILNAIDDTEEGVS